MVGPLSKAALIDPRRDGIGPDTRGSPSLAPIHGHPALFWSAVS
jgi:hypothetical protein